jgi:glutamine amidotransferase
MKLVVVKYNAGNVGSVVNALHRLGVAPLVSDDRDEIKTADKVIFPGVGEASSTMRCLNESGLDHVIKSLTQPVLGICLGMQLMCVFSEENNTQCLGIFEERSRLFKVSLKVPQIGWNRVFHTDSPLFQGIPQGSHFYFVHSYYVEIGGDTCGTTDYEVDFSAAISKKNFHAVQFHPEKSGRVGASLLKNFLEKVE